MKLDGVLAPIPTPFDEDDRVDTRRLTAALSKWASRPLHGVVVLGSNGEAVLVDEIETDRVVAAAREASSSDAGRAATDLVQQWLNSPIDRDVLLSPNVRTVGVGIAKINGTCYATADFAN